MSAGDGSAHYDEDPSGPNHRTGDAVRNPAQVSFFLLEPTADAAMTYFWADRDIYVSGPDAMIATAVRVLRDRGAPGHLIRYDLSDEA